MTNAALELEHAAAEGPRIALSADGKRLALVRGGVLVIDGSGVGIGVSVGGDAGVGGGLGQVVAAALPDREMSCVARDAVGHSSASGSTASGSRTRRRSVRSAARSWE